MTLRDRLKSPNSRVRFEAKRELRKLEELAEELGRKKPWWTK